MKLIYIGVHDSVDVPLPFGGGVTAKKNEPVNLPDSLSVKLLEQAANWKKAEENKGGK